jgi:hypothetical protein
MPATIPAGFTRLTMRNGGAEDHHAMFMRVNDDASLADLEAALTGPDIGAILAVSSSLGGPVVGPGQQASVVADLEPGQYMVICLVPDAEGMPHYVMGMQAPLEVTEADDGPPAPAADLTVELVDFGFVMESMELSPGQHIWEAPNVGEQLHELVVLRLAAGVTLEQLQPMLEAMESPATPAGEAAASPPAMTGPPPFTVIGGVAPMNPGHTNWALLDLEPGEYVAICFVPDPESGLPHFALGMLMPFTVA